MAVRDLPGWLDRWRAGCASGAIALSFTVCAAPPDREQGLPLVSTILPIRYNTPQSPVGPQVFALAPLPDGSIVLANNSGLLRLSGSADARAWNPAHGSVLALGSGSDGTVYLGGIGEIGYFREFGRDYVSFGDWAARLNVQFGDFWIALAARNGDAYFADATHVYRWDGSALQVVYTGQPEMLQGAALGDGVAVLDPGAGIVALDRLDARLVAGSDRLKSGNCALAAAQDAVVAVCADGVSRWNRDGALSEQSLSNEVRALLKTAGITTAKLDATGQLLVGTRRAGVLWLDADGALGGRLSIPEWGESRVFSLLPRRDDGFWVGLDYGIAHVEWPGQLARYDALLGLPRAIIATLRIDGRLLVATTRGVYRLVDAAADTAAARFEAYAPTQTTLFAVAQAGDTLFIASGDGIYAVKGGVATKVDTTLAYQVFPLDEHTLLAGGLNGARLLREEAASWSAQRLPWIDSEVRHFLPDRDGAIWLSGNYTGAYRLHFEGARDPSVEHFTEADGLPVGRIVPLQLPDRIVFDSASGLLRFDAAIRRFVADAAMQALLPHAQGATRRAVSVDAEHVLVVQHDRVRLLERAGGGPWREAFTPLSRLPRGMDFRDLRIDPDGAIWIAANEALFRHRPQTQTTLPPLPRPRIALDEAPESPASGTAQLGVAPRNVRVRFEEAFFDGVEQLRFRTRLDPLETRWSEWQQAPEREMTSLPGGSYQLVVQARDIFGRDSATANVAFSLQPPWYLRWWAFALEALVFLLLLAGLIRRRDRILRRRAAELAELVRQRTLELERASITDALTGLRNRHYVQLTGTPWHHGDSAFWLVALVDIDHFKRINDERGHAIGDDVLRNVASRLAATLPEGAAAVRWGGEEFLVMVALSEAASAAEIVRRLLQAIGDSRVTLSTPPSLGVTCSIGWDIVAADTTSSLDMVLSSADHKLYAAKRAGRDRAYGPGDVPVIRR